MGMENNVPEDIGESITEYLGVKEVKFMMLLQVETKQDKFENKVLVVLDYRLSLFSVKVPTKLELNIAMLDIQTLESCAPNKLLLTSNTKKLSCSMSNNETDCIDRVIDHIAYTLAVVFPSVTLEKRLQKVEVSPAERWSNLQKKLKQGHKEPGPCGGFSATYCCMCDYHLLPFMEDVAWDVDTITLSQNSRELNLADFDHLDGKHLVPIILALEHNSWFTKLNATGQKLMPDVIQVLLYVLRRNSTLESLVFSDIGAKWDFANKLAVSLLANESSALHSLDLSNNLIEDRGLNHICGPLSKLTRGLVHLNLAHTGITAKGVNKLAEALTNNKFVPTSLKSLDLTENSLKGEETSTLFNFLAQPNALSTLKLSGCDCAIDVIFGALLRGCCQSLTHLDLSNNVFPPLRKGKDVPPSWKLFFSSTMALKYLNLSGTRLPTEALKQLLLGISSNSNMSELELDLSRNMLGLGGAQILEMCVPDIMSISSLDLSDNAFDMALMHLVGHVGRNRNLKKLMIGQNLVNVKQKHLPDVLEAVVQMIQADNSAIESLSLADSRMRMNTPLVINALGTNISLTEIDLSGNQMGDNGARMLAKALQINSHLRCIYWDRNNTSPQGFTVIATALEKNFTMLKMPTPVNDATAALKLSPQKTELALKKIEGSLQRNHNPRRFDHDQAYLLQQSFLISSMQQMIDSLVIQVNESISGLESLGVSDNEDIERAQSYIKDANMSRQVLPRLQEVALKSEHDGNSVQQKLQSIAQDLQSVIEHQLKTNIEDMLSCAGEQCPTVLEDIALLENMQMTSTEKGVVSKDFMHSLLVEQLGTDVMNKLSELNLAVASHISDRLVDALLETLDKSLKTLNRLKTEQSVRPAESVDAADKDGQSEKEARRSQKHRKETSSSKLSDKKKSLYSRRLRPQSVIDSTPFSDAPSTGSLPPIGDLPPAESGAPKLEHLGKLRPRRPKNRAVSRAILDEPTPTPEDGVTGFFEKLPSVSENADKPNGVAGETVDDAKTREENAKVEAARKKGWSPFGNKADGKGIAAGISNFFGRKNIAEKPVRGTRIAGQPSPIGTPEGRCSLEREVPPKDMEKKSDKEEEKGEDDAEKEPVSATRVTPVMSRVGVPMMGGGGGAMLAEMKARRSTIMAKQSEEQKTRAPSVMLRSSAGSVVRASPSEDDSSKPKPVPSVRTKPPPPLAPKPSKPTHPPKPAFMPTGRFSDPADEDAPQRSASSMKRSSVLQKAAFIDSNRNEDPGVYSKHRVPSADGSSSPKTDIDGERRRVPSGDSQASQGTSRDVTPPNAEGDVKPNGMAASVKVRSDESREIFM